MYYRILGYVDTIDDASYPAVRKQADGTRKEVMVQQWTYNLRIPGQKDFTRVTIAADVEGAPSKDVRDKWEDVETLVSIEADRLTTVAGGGEGGDKAWAFASFHGTAIKEATQDEQRALKNRRKQMKQEQHDRRELARQEKLAAKGQVKAPAA